MTCTRRLKVTMKTWWSSCWRGTTFIWSRTLCLSTLRTWQDSWEPKTRAHPKTTPWFRSLFQPRLSPPSEHSWLGTEKRWRGNSTGPCRALVIRNFCWVVHPSTTFCVICAFFSVSQLTEGCSFSYLFYAVVRRDVVRKIDNLAYVISALDIVLNSQSNTLSGRTAPLFLCGQQWLCKTSFVALYAVRKLMVSRCWLVTHYNQ